MRIIWRCLRAMAPLTTVFTLNAAALEHALANNTQVLSQHNAALIESVQRQLPHTSLDKNQQYEELAWFVAASKSLRGTSIRVVAEDLAVHRYEADILTKLFYELTGIRVNFEITEEDDLVKKLQVQMDMGLHIYDAYVNDADFLGTHYRRGVTVPISDYISNQWKQYTLPTLDLADFIGTKYTTSPSGVLYQLPSQQFASLYWYRHDWFTRAEFKEKFIAKYGYPLGVAKDWQSYEDIANFFTNDIKYIDSIKVWGHSDYGGADPSVGWRISDGWLSMAGASDIGLPNGQPVDDWGIRVEGCQPVGASVERGGALNSPAAIYSLKKYLSWLKLYANPNTIKNSFKHTAITLGQGDVAQQIFFYTAFVPELMSRSKLTSPDGEPLWRLAPSPVSSYWKAGMKNGYQDIGAWTFLKNTPEEKLISAWLFAQFTVSKSVTTEKFLVSGSFIRQTDIQSDFVTENAPRFGGLVEFYRSKISDLWTPTGTNVPEYAYLASAWWQHIIPALNNLVTPTEAMNNLAHEIDERLIQIAEKYPNMECPPKLNNIQKAELWLKTDSAPWPKLPEQYIK